MKTYSDSQLVGLAAGGDGEAFRVLVEKHCDMVFRFAFRWCGVREDAEDIAQDVMMRLADRIRQFDADGAALTTWLYRVTINAAKDAQRRKMTRIDNEREYASLHELQNSNLAQEPRLAQYDSVCLLDRLPEKEKESVFLVFCEGLSHKEAAGIAGCAESTISWRVHSARNKLKAWARK